MNAPPFRFRTLERAAWDRCLSDDDARTVGAGMAARWFGERVKAPRHRWRPYPRRPGWLLCPLCGGARSPRYRLAVLWHRIKLPFWRLRAWVAR